ncbi:cytochrome b [Wuchereria bancrofti]|uniref:Cytochrome b n=1 Tax=Wuchereria bancrofti TaxID=6293 RepID=J9DZF4_WUCBA|nr:cytochrome b [Wuchereria bancrofti]
MLISQIITGLIYGSYRLSLLWISGVVMYLVLMGIAFTVYVLIWGQNEILGCCCDY